MVEKDVEMFLEACELKGLSMKTIGSYEQTLRLFMQHLYKIGIERTENVTHLTIQGYIQEIRRRGKYTAVTNQDARNYPENRPDYGKQVSDVTINNYLRNLRVFFNWCVDEDIAEGSGKAIAGESQGLETGYGRVHEHGEDGIAAVRHAAQERRAGEQPEPERG